ncbi:MAG TPA: UDP-N-acetylmuramate--L-alanine ligase [Firmicutes bacterium]|nr:UDP-N-acetylmuramate--L-alanine ligase [Bacillota bacterium]
MAEKTKKIHFIGVGGAGMNGIAEICINMGYRVSGSDMKKGPNTERIRKLGGRIYIGHSEKNVKKADVAVYSNAVPDTNPEILEAKKMKIPVLPRAVMLDEILRLKTGIAIAGSHGKTTTTSMLAEIFVEAKKDPTYIVGGVVKANGLHAKAGKGRYVIAEACEAYGSFLHLNPVIAGVTNIDNDHMDFYKKMDALKEAFVNFINKIPFYGMAYLNGDDENIRSILDDIFARHYLFGFSGDNDMYAENIRPVGMGQKFDVCEKGKKLGEFELGIPGKYNVMNALCAIAIACGAGIKPPVIKRALKKFKNVQRRFNVYKNRKFTIVDDYAHHPVEIKKVLEAGKEVADKKVIAVFQPHLFSRTKQMYKEFAAALSAADCVILDNIYPAREKPMPGVTSALISDRMKRDGFKDVFYEKDGKKIIERLRKVTGKGDFVFLLGAGNINEMRKKIEKELL